MVSSAVIGSLSRGREDGDATFDAQFASFFRLHVSRVTRVLDRLSGEPDLAADLVQDAFVRLYHRGAMPEAPEAWLISVALNLLRNARTTVRRRARLLEGAEVEVQPGAALSPDAGATGVETRQLVQAALSLLPERDRQLLLLRAEGYSYRDVAHALGLHEASVGTLLARAKEQFRTHYRGGLDAP